MNLRSTIPLIFSEKKLSLFCRVCLLTNVDWVLLFLLSFRYGGTKTGRWSLICMQKTTKKFYTISGDVHDAV